MALAPLTFANGIQTPIHFGRTWANPENDGDAAQVIQFPAGIPGKNESGDANTSDFMRNWMAPQNKGGTYLWVTNWTDPNGTVWPYAGSYFFRSMNYDYPPSYLNDGAFNYLYPVGLQEYRRYDVPKIFIVSQDTTVDFIMQPADTGLTTYTYPSSGGVGPRPAPIIDPTLVTEFKVHTSWRYIPGVQLDRVSYAWSWGTSGQDYVIRDMTLTNNGISGRKLDEWPTPPSAPPVLDNQTLTGVIWARSSDWRNVQAPGDEQGKDQACMYVQPWGDPGHYAVMSYDTDAPTVDGPDWGDPATDAYYENFLLGQAYTLMGPLFTSTGSGADETVDDLNQPAFRTVWYERGFDMQGSSPYFATGDVQGQREAMADGSISLPVNTNYADFPATAAVASENAGPTSVTGYGAQNGDLTLANVPQQGWTIGWNESVRIVNMWAASGIDQETGRAIGAKWNQHIANADPVADYMSAADIATVQSGVDSVYKAAALAYWNYNGTWPPNVNADSLAKWGLSDHVAQKPAAYDQPYNLADGPRPPGFIMVRPRAAAFGGGIEVRWGTEAESVPNYDTGVNDFAKYRIYRQAISRLAPWQLVAEGPAGWFAMEGDSTYNGVTIPAGRYFIDPNVTAGQDYWYSVVAVNDGSQNWEYNTAKPLESSRWPVWTGNDPVGATALSAGVAVTSVNGAHPNRFALEQNAPNPFNPTTTIRFSLEKSGLANVAVYNVAGQLVRTLVNKSMDAGVHELVWDGMDNTGRPAASGVYVYRLTSGQRQLMKRMVLVR
jgi:hypothetical protein